MVDTVDTTNRDGLKFEICPGGALCVSKHDLQLLRFYVTNHNGIPMVYRKGALFNASLPPSLMHLRRWKLFSVWKSAMRCLDEEYQGYTIYHHAMPWAFEEMNHGIYP